MNALVFGVVARLLAFFCRRMDWEAAFALDENDEVVNIFCGPADQVEEYVKSADGAVK